LLLLLLLSSSSSSSINISSHHQTTIQFKQNLKTDSSLSPPPQSPFSSRAARASPINNKKEARSTNHLEASLPPSPPAIQPALRLSLKKASLERN
jgi:hypothetical protein